MGVGGGSYHVGSVGEIDRCRRKEQSTADSASRTEGGVVRPDYNVISGFLSLPVLPRPAGLRSARKVPAMLGQAALADRVPKCFPNFILKKETIPGQKDSVQETKLWQEQEDDDAGVLHMHFLSLL